MKLNKLALGDKKLFESYLSLCRHDLSVYSFENIYIWKGLFDIRWALIEEMLCVFFADSIGWFLYLPPLGKKLSRSCVEKAFEVLDKHNKNKDISRIENAEDAEARLLRALGYSCKVKSYDYVCLRKDLTGLTGQKYRHKRSSVNYFLKHYDFQWLPYTLKERSACVKLYKLWASQRAGNSGDPAYQWMIEDSLNSLSVLLRDYPKLNLSGGLVKIGKEIKAFTFGFPLNKDTFCILYEITDLSVKGLAQFIFRKFCSELKDYQHINIMDDSGLENLRKVKLSYHPVKTAPCYALKRNG